MNGLLVDLDHLVQRWHRAEGSQSALLAFRDRPLFGIEEELLPSALTEATAFRGCCCFGGLLRGPNDRCQLSYLLAACACSVTALQLCTRHDLVSDLVIGIEVDHLEDALQFIALPVHVLERRG